LRQEIFFKILFVFGILTTGGVSLLPRVALPDTGVSDKLEHLLAYGVLSLVGCRAFADPVSRILIGLVLYGIVLEGLQSLVPGRVPSLMDVVANTLGVGLGYLVLIFVRRGTAGPR
jgi:VanZ family protein